MKDSPPPKSPHWNGYAPTSVLFDELVAEILLRIPMKTLVQFKYVCKSWKTLISHDPSFAKLHLHWLPHNTYLVMVSDPSDAQSSLPIVIISVSRLLESPQLRNITIPNDPYDLLSDLDCWFIVGSCNGLIYLQGDFSPTSPQNYWLRFWNLATKTLSKKLGYLTNYFRFTFGYDVSNYTYKVVAFSAKRSKFSVWRDISCFSTVAFDMKASDCRLYENIGVYVRDIINCLAIRNMTDQYE